MRQQVPFFSFFSSSGNQVQVLNSSPGDWYPRAVDVDPNPLHCGAGLQLFLERPALTEYNQLKNRSTSPFDPLLRLKIMWERQDVNQSFLNKTQLTN